MPRLLFRWLSVIAVLGLSSVGPIATAPAEEPAFVADAAGYRKTLAPFLKQHCLRCHGPDDQQAMFRVDAHLGTDFLDRAVKEKWGEVVNVLNSHEMPPEDEPQPSAEQVAEVVDWITRQMIQAELHQRDSAIMLRRLTRTEYQNTIRDLIGFEFDATSFPEDPPTGGFDNNAAALTISPLHMELYFKTAQAILNRALVEGPAPPKLRWRFEPESGDSDSNRVEYDGQRVIVNGGRSPSERGFKILRNDRWDRKLNARSFALPHAGDYVVRIRAAGRVPPRPKVVESAATLLAERRDREIKKSPNRREQAFARYEQTLDHFRTDPIYDYGPPRLKLMQKLGGQPHVLAEFDVAAPLDAPQVYEVPCRFTTESAGVTIQYAYALPRVLENFWMQNDDAFARPELWVDWFEIEGPLNPTWPPESHTQILFESPLAESDPRDYARQVLARFMTRAWRRPVTAAEIDAKLALYDEAVAAGDEVSFVQAIKAPLTAVLVSPHFIYLAEPAAAAQPDADKADAAARALTAHQLANRLAYFLWSAPPDESLRKQADDGQLTDHKQLMAQVRRMLDDPKSEALAENFAGQWLGLREVGANPPASDLFPRYDDHLQTSIVGESQAFFGEILRNDLDAMNLVRSDFVVINERLARFYGIPGVRGDHFRRVPVPEGVHRGGVVTQASILTITSNGTRTSPVKRGVWVMKNLLGIDPGLPVANAGEIAPKVPGIDKATVRQRLEIHRSLAQCARCHNKIDPLGFALENFNAAGAWRDREGFGYKGRVGRNDPPIDASAQLPDGTKFVGVDGLRAALSEREDLFLRCLAEKMFTYALGRELGVADRVHVQAAVDHMRRHDRTLRSLIEFVATSQPFLTK